MFQPRKKWFQQLKIYLIIAVELSQVVSPDETMPYCPYCPFIFAPTERRDIPLFLKRGEVGRCEVYRKTVSEDVKSFAVKQNVKLLNCVEAVVQMYKLEIITIKPRQRSGTISRFIK